MKTVDCLELELRGPGSVFLKGRPSLAENLVNSNITKRPIILRKPAVNPLRPIPAYGLSPLSHTVSRNVDSVLRTDGGAFNSSHPLPKACIHSLAWSSNYTYRVYFCL